MVPTATSEASLTLSLPFSSMSSTMQNSSPSPNTPENTADNFLHELPEAPFMEITQLYNWEGVWLNPETIPAAATFRSSFRARDDDVFIASTMKTGTTWVKAITLCITQNRQTLNSPDHDLLTKENPHFYIPTIETIAFRAKPPPFDPYDPSLPRLLHTHLPYSVLPDSVKNSDCKMVYIARNPKDTLMSMWHFYNSWLRPDGEAFPLEKAVDYFCSGVHPFGPFFEQVVGYWEESRKRPEKILFLKYEDLKRDPTGQVSRIAEHLGRPFGDGGEAEEVVRRCSFERLRDLEVNQGATVVQNKPNSVFFRKGEVGDWKNHLTPEMEIRIDELSRVKLEAAGLFL